jgi:hypothetical protein
MLEPIAEAPSLIGFVWPLGFSLTRAAHPRRPLLLKHLYLHNLMLYSKSALDSFKGFFNI